MLLKLEWQSRWRQPRVRPHPGLSQLDPVRGGSGLRLPKQVGKEGNTACLPSPQAESA